MVLPKGIYPVPLPNISNHFETTQRKLKGFQRRALYIAKRDTASPPGAINNPALPADRLENMFFSTLNGTVALMELPPALELSSLPPILGVHCIVRARSVNFQPRPLWGAVRLMGIPDFRQGWTEVHAARNYSCF